MTAGARRVAWLVGGAVAVAAAVAVSLALTARRAPLVVTSVRALAGGEALVHALPVTVGGEDDPTRPSVLALIDANGGDGADGAGGVRWSVEIRPGALVGELAEPHLLGDAATVFALFARRTEPPDPHGTPLELTAWDRQSGAPRWTKALPDADNEFPSAWRLALDGGALFVMDRGIGLTALDPMTGAERWSAPSPALGPVEGWRFGATTIGALGREGTALVARADGRRVGSVPIVSEACQLGDALLGPSSRDGEVVLGSLDPAVAPRVVAGAGLEDAIWCASWGGRIVAFDEARAVAVDVATGAVAWRRELGRVAPSELVRTVLRGVRTWGDGRVVELVLQRAPQAHGAAAEPPGGARWAALDLATGELTPRGEGALGVSALGAGWLVGERAAARPRVVLFDGAGRALAAWTAERRLGLLLRPWAVADGRLWAVDPRPLDDLDALAFTVVSLATGEALSRHGEPLLAPLPAGTDTPLAR